jgi:vancomycin resistance protein YoaR
MKRFVIAFVALLLIGGVALALMAARFESKTPPNTTLGSLPIGGLSKAEVAEKLDQWWQEAGSKSISLKLAGKEMSVKMSDLHVAPDSAASLGQLKFADVWDSTKQAVGVGDQGKKYAIRFTSVVIPTDVDKFVHRNTPQTPLPRVYFVKGAIKADPGAPVYELDKPALLGLLADAVSSDKDSIEVPMKKTSSDSITSQITEVVSSFTTKFPVRKKDRNTNIRIASGKINGLVLLPGQRFSFNNVVGRRTIQDGFKEAPVFKNGKHDMGVGGGICQVSSTLYNAALFSDLKVVERHNHSMPVAYLPVGRDATVDYGTLDLAFENNTPGPIAISSDYEAGNLTFRILGKKNPSMAVKIESSDSDSWDAPTKTVSDPRLPFGTKKVVEKGSRGHSIRTFRVVYKDGVEVAREPLGRSYYRGGQRVVAVGTKVITPFSSGLPVVPPPAPSGGAVPR